jgi:hypothetical protein
MLSFGVDMLLLSQKETGRPSTPWQSSQIAIESSALVGECPLEGAQSTNITKQVFSGMDTL